MVEKEDTHMTFKVKDHYFYQAKKEDYLARSVYKLKEIDEKFRIFQKSQSVLDLGYHPGSWIQYALEKVGKEGRVIGLDIRPIQEGLAHIKNVSLYQKDIFTVTSVKDIDDHLEDFFDVVCSDMAPNTTGIKTVDQLRSLELVENVFTLLPILLKVGGHCVIKIFEGKGVQELFRQQKARFTQFHLLRPKSTRSASKEIFVIGKGFRS
jgi:23S rRNA (uridine2552-2'-O)-methyltransferase